jgi:hypothetical protein
VITILGVVVAVGLRPSDPSVGFEKSEAKGLLLLFFFYLQTKRKQRLRVVLHPSDPSLLWFENKDNQPARAKAV